MFCKVCQDAGKPKSVCTSHSVRDAKGQVVCPTLLNQKCAFCKKAGHTVKYCPKLKGKYNPNHQTNTLKKEEPAAATIHKQQEQQFRRRARELCSSPPPPPMTQPQPYKGQVIPFTPTPVGEKPNYFHLLSVDENNKETTTFGKLSDNYLEIAKERVEAANREREETKEVDLKKHRKNLLENFPALGRKEQERATVVMPTPNPVWHTTRPTETKFKREDSPPPSPVSSQPPEAPPAPKKMPKVSEETSTPPPPTSTSSYQAPPVLRWADYDD